MSRMNMFKVIRKKRSNCSCQKKEDVVPYQETEASFLCPNCIGGILFHDLGMRFYSPTL